MQGDSVFNKGFNKQANGRYIVLLKRRKRKEEPI